MVPHGMESRLWRRGAGVLLLPLPLLAEGIVALRDVGFVTIRIDEWIRRAGLHLFILGFQAEVGAMRAEEDVAGETLQDREHLHVIVGDPRIILVANQNVA